MSSVSHFEFSRFEQWVWKHLKAEAFLDLKELKDYLKEIKRGYSDLYESELKYSAQFPPKDNPAWTCVNLAIDWESLKAEGQEVELFRNSIAEARTELQTIQYNIDESKKHHIIKHNEAQLLGKQLSNVHVFAISVDNEAKSLLRKEFLVLKLEQLIPPIEPVRDDLQLEQEGFVDSVSGGQIVPLNVRPSGDKYEVINGHRRYAALIKAGKDEADCYVWHNLTDFDVFKMRFKENFDRESPNPAETARELDRMLQVSGKTFEELGNEIGKTKGWISNHLGILGTKYEKPVEKKHIALETANIALRFEGSEEARDLFIPKTVEAITDNIVSERMSIRQADKYLEDKKREAVKKAEPAHCDSCSRVVHRDLNTLKNRFRDGKSKVFCDNCLGIIERYLEQERQKEKGQTSFEA